MKTLILILSIICLASCTTNYTVKRVEDGAILKVKDFDKSRLFKVGDTVYITEINSYSIDWQISNSTWVDTIYCSDSYPFCWSYSAAIIQKK